MKKYLIGLVLMLSTCAYGQNTNQYGSPAGKACAGGPATITDISAIPYVQYTCAGSDGHTWTAIGSNPLPAPMAGLNTYLPMTDGSGLTIRDASGNNHNATITSGGTQVWTPQGLQLNAETATLPNAGGIPTVGFCAYFPAATLSFSTYKYYSTLAAGGQNGYNFATAYGSPYGHTFDVYWPAIGLSNGGPTTVAKDGLSGNHCLEIVIGINSGTNDRIYIDGTEATYYTQGSGYALLGGGELTNPVTLSSSQTNGTFTPSPTLYSVWNATTADTAAQALSRLASETARLQSLGVVFGNAPSTQSTASSCAFDGTSIDVGFEATAAPPTLLSLDYPCTITNFSRSGQDPKDMDAGFQNRAALIYHPRGAKNILYNGGPTNGLMNDGESVQDAFQDVLAWNRKAHAQGWKTVVSTMLSRTGTGTGGLTGDVLAQQFNALLLANGDAFDWVANMAAAPQLGATGAYASTTYFNADGVHPKDAGQTYYVAGMRAGFEGVYANPLTTVTAAYTQVPSDRLIVANSSSAFAVTLIDANTASFNSAGELCLKNAGTGTVTLTPVNSETIDGAANLAVAAQATACIRPYVANPAAGGAVWIKVQP